VSTQRANSRPAQLCCVLYAHTVWAKRALEVLPELKGRYLNYYLPHYCYVFTSGPFKGLLARHGFDATAHPECRYLQTVSVRFNLSMLKQIRQRYDNEKVADRCYRVIIVRFVQIVGAPRKCLQLLPGGLGQLVRRPSLPKAHNL
jgi:hypothetical protein